MKCPICGAEQYCHCNSCLDKLPIGERTQLVGIARGKCGEFITIWKCGYCGHEASEEQWTEDEQKQLKEGK